MILRKAVQADIPFLIRGIVEAEKSGTESHFYALTFGLSDEQTAQLIANCFEEEIENQEWCVAHFFVAEENGEPMACLSAWIEKPGMEGSGILKAQMLSYFLGNKWSEAADKLKLVAEVQVERTAGTLQLECIYTAPAARGRGVAGQLIQYTLETLKHEESDVEGAEIQLMTENETALRSYTKCGFLRCREKQSQRPEILNLLPGAARVVLCAKI